MSIWERSGIKAALGISDQIGIIDQFLEPLGAEAKVHDVYKLAIAYD